jgi:nucleoid DNA-binding protein
MVDMLNEKAAEPEFFNQQHKNMKGTEFDLGDLSQAIVQQAGPEILATISNEKKLEKVVKFILELVPGSVSTALVENKRIEWAGLGVLELTPTAAGVGKNFATGDPIPFPAGNKVKFRTAKRMKEAITQRTGKPTK